MTNLTTGRSAIKEVSNGKQFIAITGSDYASGVTIDWSQDGVTWVTLQDTIGEDTILTANGAFIVEVGAGQLSLKLTGVGDIDYTITSVN